MLVGLWRHHVPVDLILFADPGAEQPHTYAYLDTMSRWLENHGMPAITRVWYTEKNGQRLTLEQECLRSGTLPSIAYGYKKCSLKHKVAPQEKFCRHYQPCIDAWEKGEKVVKFIGYDAGEERRLLNALPHDLQDKKYQKEYPLMEWGKAPQELHPGDVVNIPPEVKHWHGAAPDCWFSHLAVEVPGEDTSNEWCEPVPEETYKELR